ncbi:MAG: ribosomal protein large subunit ribosomal protein [Parcubacteria group bacterium]|nr:ribosomal protein large subunit ribosomal protein [Parcubacteria group bacterium]
MELAVIKTGGKQYVVSPGALVTIEKLGTGASTLELKKGDTVTFDEVLMTDNGKDTVIGTPSVAGAKVTGTVQVIGRNKKIEVVKYKAKSNYFKRRGHRQPHIKVKIDKIG